MRALGRPALRILTISLAAAAAWSGCARRGPEVPPLPDGRVGGDAMAERIAARPCPSTLASDLEVRVDPAGGSAVQLFGSLRAVWPDRVRLQLRLGPFLPVLSMAIEGDSATLFLPRDGAYWRGPARGPFGGPLVWARAVLDALCPADLARDMRDPVLTTLSGGRWILSGSRPGAPGDGGWVEFRSDRKGRHGEVAVIVLRHPDGGLQASVQRAGRKRVGTSEIPEQLRVETSEPEAAVHVRLLRLRPDPNAGVETFRIVPSADARRMDDEEFREILRRLGSGAAGRFSLPDSAILG